MSDAFARDYVATQKTANMLFHENSRNHGFWADVDLMRDIIVEHAPDLAKRFERMAIAEKIALMHSELSEALEAIRKNPDAPDHHCPEFTNLEVEFADTIIRIGEMAHYYKLRLAEATLAKHEANATRPYKHGKIS